MPVQPRNAMCSCAWAMPGKPAGVSSPPTRKFVSTVTTGARALRRMTTRMPFGRVALRAVPPAAGGGAASVRALWVAAAGYAVEAVDAEAAEVARVVGAGATVVTAAGAARVAAPARAASHGGSGIFLKFT